MILIQFVSLLLQSIMLQSAAVGTACAGELYFAASFSVACILVLLRFGPRQRQEEDDDDDDDTDVGYDMHKDLSMRSASSRSPRNAAGYGTISSAGSNTQLSDGGDDTEAGGSRRIRNQNSERDIKNVRKRSAANLGGIL